MKYPYLLCIAALVVGYAWIHFHVPSSLERVVTPKGNVFYVTNIKHALVLDRLLDKLHVLMEHSKHPNMKRFEGKISEIPRRMDMKEVAYTIDKGKEIAFCIEGQDENTLFYVALHEIAHVISDSTGHTKEFWDNFSTLLEESIHLGLYIYQPFHKRQEDFCGVNITRTPYECSNCHEYVRSALQDH